MPALAFLAVVGLVLASLVACDRYGLPKVSRHPYLPYTTHSPAINPASAPDVTSQAVFAALPSETPAKVDPTARAARADAPSKKMRATQQPIGYPQSAQPPEAPAKVDPAARSARAEAPAKKMRVTQQPIDYQQNFDRFSIKGQ